MILDTLAQWRRYAAISPRFKIAFEYLSTFDPATPAGRHDIAGDDVYAGVQKYTTKNEEPLQYEAHRAHIDIQYVHSGRETILWAPLSAMKKVTMPFDVNEDAALYAAVPDGLALNLSAGQFTILFPEDAHAPKCVWGSPSEMLKVVVKVRV